MKFMDTVKRTLIIIGIIVLSVIAGYIVQMLGHKADIKSHPREFGEYVEKYSDQYGVPEYILYSYILNVSGFKSNLVSDGERTGLMQYTPEILRAYALLEKENIDTGLLYDPDTNIKYGAYMMSFLYTKYNRWNAVIAACLTDEETVDGWLEIEKYTDDIGNLVTIPDPAVSSKVKAILEDADLYNELYYINQ